MTTPLGLVRELRAAFPEFIEVKMVREAPFKLRAYCALESTTKPVSDERLQAWSLERCGAGTVLAIDQVQVFPLQIEDEECLLRRTSLPRVLVEEASTTGSGLLRHLQELFPGQVLDLSDRSGHIAIIVDAALPSNQDQEIVNTARLLMAHDVFSLEVSRQQTPTRQMLQHTQAESASTYQRLQEDLARLHEYLPQAIEVNVLPLPQLPEGSSTYASGHDGVESLLHRLALFERVYMYIPFAAADFPQWVGSSLSNFVDVLPTGRVIPVFGQSISRYEAGLMTRILDAGAPYVVLRGEHALRLTQSFRTEHPALGIVTSEAGVECRQVLAEQSDKGALLLATYLDALADVSSSLPRVVLSGQAFVNAIDSIARWIDDIRVSLGLPTRDLEIAGAIEHRTATEAVAGAPMVRGDHYFDGALRFVYGAEPVSNEIIRIPEPELIGRICFPDTAGLTPREFATSFHGPRVNAMRALMLSPRVQAADGSTDLFKEFNDELQTYAHRTDVGYTATAAILTVVGAFALGGPTAIAGLGLDLARRILGRKAPVAFAALTSLMTGTTREAALLARILKK